MKKLTKSDITFMIAMTFFAIVSFSRFFDEKIKKHIVLFDIMQDYEWAIFFTILYFVVVLLFFVVCITNCENKYKKDIYYLICFYATFVFPMFLSSKYFGATDIYGWMLTWISLALLIRDKLEWLTIVGCFLSALISPMSVLTGICSVLVMLAYKFWSLNERKYLWYLLACIITAISGLMAAYACGVLSTDPQSILTYERFLILLMVLSPYLYIAVRFFVQLWKKTKDSKRWGYVLFLVGVLPSAVVYILLEDYARAIFHAFAYVILVVIAYVARNDWDVICQLQETKDKIKQYVPIPVLVIAIPFLFMTLWIAGQQHLMKEVFINK